MCNVRVVIFEPREGLGTWYEIYYSSHPCDTQTVVGKPGVRKPTHTLTYFHRYHRSICSIAWFWSSSRKCWIFPISQISDYSLVQFLPLDISQEDSLADVLLYIDNTIQYGEDLDVKVPKVSESFVKLLCSLSLCCGYTM